MKTDVCVVGAGPVGFAAVLGFIQLGYSVRWLYKPCVPTSAQSLPIYMLTRASAHILQHLGVWSYIEHHKGPVYQMRIWDGEGSGEITFPAPNEMPMAWTVAHGDLLSAFEQKIDTVERGLLLRTPTVLKNVRLTTSGISLETQDGQYYESNVLCAADGANSWVRQHLSIPTTVQAYQQEAWTTKVQLSAHHHQTAWQRFSKEGPLAFLPLPNSQEAAVIWSRNLALESVEELDKALQCASEGVLGTVTRLIPWKKDQLLERHAQNYVLGASVLVGDAAHTFHPLAGQGLNMGLLDVACLLEQFQTRPINIFQQQRALTRYARLRRGHNSEMMKVMMLLHRGYQIEMPLFKKGRNFGLHAINRLPYVKHQLIQYAMGQFNGAPWWAKGAPA